MSEEILACFDEQGNEIAPQPRSEVLKMPRRWWCGAGNVFLVRPDGKILCSKRGLHGNKPNFWQARFGGHMKHGSSFIKTAQAELEEETGVAANIKDLIFISRSEYLPQKYFIENYLYIFDDDDSKIKLDSNEVVEMKWMTFDEYNQAVASSPEIWTDPCSLDNQQKIKNLL